MTTLTYTGTLVIEECCNCHIIFAMPEDFQRRCREVGPDKTFFCPLGHPQHYRDSEVRTLENQLAAARRQLDWAQSSARAARDQANAAERSRAAYKGQLTKTRKRIGNGVCPCCSRHFRDVERHMKGQHPDYAES
jgi:hypothetical protein